MGECDYCSGLRKVILITPLVANVLGFARHELVDCPQCAGGKSFDPALARKAFEVSARQQPSAGEN